MTTLQLGLRENWRQFGLLVIVNAFVGGMLGLERTILPAIAGAEFHLAINSAILSFIFVFGVSKAFTNYFTGRLANSIGRKRLLILGWLIALPIPLLLMFGGSWGLILFANILLGISQGLTWSVTVIMKIDLVSAKQRGLAMGLNEFAGYISVAVVALATGWIASSYGLRPYPFIMGIVMALIGLLLSWIFVKDTHAHAIKESLTSTVARLSNVFRDTVWQNRNLSTVTQAGLVNNLNDGMIWGLFPILLALKGFTLREIAILAAVYPAVWGVAQLATGRLSDVICKKDILFAGMLLQGVSLLFFPFAFTFTQYLILAALLGLGTALVYPTFLATIAENTHPVDRSESLGIFRFWRDLGYAIGALLTGTLADLLGVGFAIILIAILTIVSSLIILLRMRCFILPQKRVIS